MPPHSKCMRLLIARDKASKVQQKGCFRGARLSSRPNSLCTCTTSEHTTRARETRADAVSAANVNAVSST
eukprot:7457-Alexandrium_andersonii.AAC.1